MAFCAEARCCKGPGDELVDEQQEARGNAAEEVVLAVAVPVVAAPEDAEVLEKTEPAPAAPADAGPPAGGQAKTAEGGDSTVPGGDSAAGSAAKDDGNQRVTYDDGSTYNGQIVDLRRHGYGSWISTAGQYDGQWKDDAQHGFGKQTWSDGRCYEGEFSNGQFYGKGKMVWRPHKGGELVYEGEYKEDLKEGVGKFMWSDGRSYDGDWSKGKRHGKGTYTNARGEQKVGHWVDDKFDHWE